MRKLRKERSAQEKERDRKYNRERRRIIRKTRVQFKLIGELDPLQQNFEQYESRIHWKTCHKCSQKTLVDCYSKKSCKNCKMFQLGSSLHPGYVPDCLSDLTFIERQLISRVHPVVSLYKIQNCQFGYKGNVINFPQNVQEIVDILPLKVCDISNVITIRLDRSDTYHDFLVRRNSVHKALIWLQKNNPFYSNIQISEDNLSCLPESSNVYKDLKGYDVVPPNDVLSDSGLSSTSAGSDNESDDIPVEDETDENFHGVTYTDVPDSKGYTHRDKVSNSLNHNVQSWPTIGKNPLNEFSSPGYISMAFPTLFPFGTGDISNFLNDKKVKMSDYVQYLMNFEDGRFAKDERFRYFLMNTLMRWNALNSGAVFVRKNQIFSKMTLLQLKAYLKEHPNVAKNIMFYASKIRSTRPYWNSRCGELLDMVNTLGPPTVFFTLSSADYHWPDLYRLLGFNVSDLTTSQKRKLLSENPLIYDKFFVLRSQYFMEHCFAKKFNVKDVWFRYEYQHRGSIHLHGVAWFADAPKLDNVSNDAVQKEIIDYFDKIVSCHNPDINCNMSSVHPCEVKLSNVHDMEVDLADLVNRVQRHTKCSDSYCKTKNGKKLSKCRYNFPFDMNEKSYLIVKDEEITEMVFKRNDPLLNKYNPWVLQTWRSNGDFSPIYNEDKVYHYIAKYASKCEPKSFEYSEILKSITSNSINENESCKTVIRKLLISACAERDYCAQEVLHYLLGLPFYRSSRDFVVLNYKHFSWESLESVNSRKSLLQYYSERPKHLSGLSLYEFCKFFCIRKGQYCNRKKAAIIRVFPKLHISRHNMFEPESYDMLYAFFVPWSTTSDLNVTAELKKERVNQVEESIKFYLCKTDMETIHERFPSEKYNSSSRTEFVDPVSSYNPLKENVRKELSLRQIDSNYDWTKWDHPLSSDTLNQIYTSMKEQRFNVKKFVLPDCTLSESQDRAFRLLKSQVHSLLKNSFTVGSVTLVQGGAGSGKSFLLKLMYNYIYEHLGHDAVIVMAPTGTAAHLVNGSTVHSVLRTGRNFNNVPLLLGDDLLNFQEGRECLYFVFIEEYSLLGCRLFAIVEERLRQMKDCNDRFGNLFVYMFGDCHQLVPSGDTALFCGLTGFTGGSGLLERGKLLVRDIDQTIILDGNFRATSSSYADFLKRVSIGMCSIDDAQKINERCFTMLPKSELEKFESGIRLCSMNDVVDDYNVRKIMELKQPIAHMKAGNNSKEAFRSSVDKAEGLVNYLYLCVGAVVMLRKNLNVSIGLVNGCIGKVFKILYGNSNGPPDLPLFVLVKFEGIDLSYLGVDYVPIKPVVTHWVQNGRRCSRVQIPLVLSWAITIHKSQGFGFPNIYLDLGDSEFCLGLIYTGLSRVSKFNRVCLLQKLTLRRLNSVRMSSRYLDLINFLDWLESKSI